MRRSYLIGLLLGAMSAPPLWAADNAPDPSGFDMPVFDATAGIDNTARQQRSPWRHTLSYDSGWDASQTRIINRVGWRLQWEGLVSANNYLVVDAKLRAFAEGDLQNSLSRGTDSQAKLNALYWQHSLSHSSWKLGYQVINLGVMDMLSINDVLSPWDYSEAAYTSPEDARIGQPMIVWTWFGQARQWDVYLNLSPDRNHYPAGTEANLAAQFGITDLHATSPQQMELVLRQRSHQGASDQQWLLGSLIQNDPNLVPLGPGSARLEFPRYSLAGYGYSYTSGNHQWKLELAYKQGLKPLDAPATQLDQLDSALGWEYNANGNWTLGIEAGRSDRSLPADALSGIHKQLSQVAMRWAKPFFHDTVNLTLYAGQANPGTVTTTSAALSYSPRDDWYIELLSTHIDSRNSLYQLLPSSTGLGIRYHW